MGDKIAQIITRSMSMIQTTLKACTTQLDPGSSQVIVFNQLFNKLGDNNARIRERAEEILLLMAGHVSFGAQTVAANITKGQVKKSSKNSIKHILGRLNLLHKVLQKYPINKHNISYQTCLDYALYGYTHQNGDIRNSAQLVIMEVYKAIGSKIKSHFSGLRQAQIELLEAGFAEIDGVDPAAAKAKARKVSPP
jgi:hypothetical protein